MTLFEQLKQIRRIDTLIQRKGTGTPEELARRLEVSRATVFRYIQALRDMGAPVSYCKSRQSYVYEGEFGLSFDRI